MRIWLPILLIGLHLRFRGSVVGMISRMNPELYENEEAVSKVVLISDLAAMGVTAALIAGVRPLWSAGGGLLLMSSLFLKDIRSPRRRIKESEWLIHLLIGAACGIADGNRFETAILTVRDNPLVEILRRLEGPFERRMNRLAHRLDSRGFNRLVSLYRQTGRFDDAALVDEIERLIDWVQRDIAALRKERVQQLNEWMVVPMALGLVNMMMMVVLPYLGNWS